MLITDEHADAADALLSEKSLPVYTGTVALSPACEQAFIKAGRCSSVCSVPAWLGKHSALKASFILGISSTYI